MENDSQTNFENNMKMLSHAVKCCEEKLGHDDIIAELYGDDDIKKQFCLIELKKINSQKEADILVYNLTQHSGPIRETAAYKISELISITEFNRYFQTKEIISTFIKAITDINPSVSRSAVEIIKYINDIEYLYSGIIKELKNTLSTIDNEVKNRSYVQNKKNFNLYWNLEAIISIHDRITPDEDLISILKITAHSNDYTIREKTAKAAKILNLDDITELLKNDTNIYVRKYTQAL